MKYAKVEKVIIQECYNNSFEVLATCSEFDLDRDLTFEVEDSIFFGDIVDSDGKLWESK